MKYLLGLFADKELETLYQSKVKEIQDTGKVPNDTEFDYNGKTVKLYLPNDVREQYKLLLLAETFLIKETLYDDDKLFKLRFDLFDNAIKRMLVDGKKEFNINEFDVDFIDTIIMVFVGDLLIPLYLRSSEKVSERFKANLKGYIKG